MTLTQHNLTII